MAERTGEGWWAPEVMRLRADIALRAGGSVEDVESQLRAALELARGREARSLSLRAAVSLAELLRDNGRGGEARELLNAEVGRFSRAGNGVPAEAKSVLQDVS